MSFPDEMRELAEGIVASKRSRRETIASLKTEVKSQLAGYESDRQAMAKELHAKLEADKAALMAHNATLMKELGELDAARQAEVGADLAEARSQLETDAALMKELKVEMEAARRAWQEGLRATPPKHKPRPPARPTIRVR